MEKEKINISDVDEAPVQTPAEKARVKKEEAIMKMKYFGSQSGKGGFRQKNTGSRFNGAKMSVADQRRSDEYYGKIIDKLDGKTSEELKEMVVDNKITLDGKRLTGAAVSAFNDTYRAVLREEFIEKQKKVEEEDKLKAEVAGEEAKEKAKTAPTEP
jgi:hypothetical protein